MPYYIAIIAKSSEFVHQNIKGECFTVVRLELALKKKQRYTMQYLPKGHTAYAIYLNFNCESFGQDHVITSKW